MKTTKGKIDWEKTFEMKKEKCPWYEFGDCKSVHTTEEDYTYNNECTYGNCPIIYWFGAI